MSGTGAHDEPPAARKLRRLRHVRQGQAVALGSSYWRSTRRTAMLAVLLWAIVALALPLVAEQLDAIGVLGIPLGYYVGAQGALVVMAIVMLVLMRRQRGLDRSYGLAPASRTRHHPAKSKHDAGEPA